MGGWMDGWMDGYYIYKAFHHLFLQNTLLDGLIYIYGMYIYVCIYIYIYIYIYIMYIYLYMYVNAKDNHEKISFIYYYSS